MTNSRDNAILMSPQINIGVTQTVCIQIDYQMYSSPENVTSSGILSLKLRVSQKTRNTIPLCDIC